MATTYADFFKTIKPGMLGLDGRFLDPGHGANYKAEGMTPEEYYAQELAIQNHYQNRERGGDSFSKFDQNNEGANPIDATWRKGVIDTKRGFLGNAGVPLMMLAAPFAAAGMGAGAAGGATAAGEAGFSGMGGVGGSLGAAGDFGAGTYAAGAAPSAGFGGVGGGLLDVAGGGGEGLVAELGGGSDGLDLAGLVADQPPAETARLASMNMGENTLAGISPGSTLGGGGNFLSNLGDKASSYLSDPSNLMKLGGTVLGALGGAAASKDSTTSSNSSRDPWAPAQPYLLDNLKTNAAMQEHYRQNPFSDLQKQQYQGLFNSLANSQANVPGLLANASAFGQSNRGRMPAMTGLLSGTQAAPIDWSQYAGIGRK